MPDLNQQDPHLARYLIQNSLWWVEYAGIDAFRIDTYAYPDQGFMKQLDEAMRLEYPDFFLFGETWVQGSPVQAWFTEEAEVKKNFNENLDLIGGVTILRIYFDNQRSYRPQWFREQTAPQPLAKGPVSRRLLARRPLTRRLVK